MHILRLLAPLSTGLLSLALSGPAAGQVVTFVDNFGTSGSGTLNFPLGVAVNASTGQVYVTDYMNNRVVRFAADGTFRTSFGSLGSGNGQFNQPIGIGVNAWGRCMSSIGTTTGCSSSMPTASTRPSSAAPAPAMDRSAVHQSRGEHDQRPGLCA